MPKPILYDYFKDKAEELLALYKTSSNQNASSNLGDNRENFLNKFLKVVLPTKLNVRNGEVIDSKNRKTGQLDTIIIRDDAPSLDFGSNNTYLSEGLFSVIEVKSNLNSEKLEEALKTLKKVEDLNIKFNYSIASGITLQRPLRVIFAYKGMTADSIAKFLRNNTQYLHTYDLICILERGVIVNTGMILTKTDQDTHTISTRPFFVPTKASALGFLYLYLVTYGTSFTTSTLELSKYFEPINEWYK